MFAKIKDTAIITFPYGFDDLQSENPHTRFTGNIDLMELFPQTEEATLRGYELVPVTVQEEPRTRPFQEAVLAQLPTWKDGSLVLEWTVRFKQP